MKSINEVMEDDRKMRTHTRRAQEELEHALAIVRKSSRTNPRLRPIELDLSRALHALDNLGTLTSKYPVEEEPRYLTSAQKNKIQRDILRKAKASEEEKPLENEEY